MTTALANDDNVDMFYVWSNRTCRFVRKHMRSIRCDECDQKYDEETWYVDGDMLVCGNCDQQFYSEE